MLRRRGQHWEGDAAQGTLPCATWKTKNPLPGCAVAGEAARAAEEADKEELAKRRVSKKGSEALRDGCVPAPWESKGK